MRTLEAYAQLVEDALPGYFPADDSTEPLIGAVPARLSESMRYSLLSGGKRLRPAMMLACADLYSFPLPQIIDYACAVEMIHTYSLIHDDLPGMDNDSLRRGKPTNHVVFGEGQAILAGDGLLNLAFETMLEAAQKSGDCVMRSVNAIAEIARGCGVRGMIAGQVLDLQCEGTSQVSQTCLSYIQHNKTACMFLYPLRAVGRLADVSHTDLQALDAFGRAFGLMFQAVDDCLDVVGDPSTLGKSVGKDFNAEKLTCVSVYGMDETRKYINHLRRQAHEALSRIEGDTSFFDDLTDRMAERSY